MAIDLEQSLLDLLPCGKLVQSLWTILTLTIMCMQHVYMTTSACGSLTASASFMAFSIRTCARC